MKKKVQVIGSVLLIASYLLTTSVYAQRAACYSFYEFEQFLTVHTVDAAAYQKEFLDNLRYPAICRENSLEGDLEFLVFHHGAGEFEIIQKNQRTHEFFEDAVNYAFVKAMGGLSYEAEAQFMTIIRIRFDIEPRETLPAFAYDFVRTVPPVKTVMMRSHD